MLSEHDFLWTEKYRPRTLTDCILPDATAKAFRTFLEQRNVPNLLLSGGAGTGKTTVAKAVLQDLGCDYMMINGSLDRNIGTLRNDIQSYVSTVSLVGGRKYVILDEADYLNQESTMPALRSFMDEFSDNAGFIFTCNWPNRIIVPLRSRLTEVDFTIPKNEVSKLQKEYVKSLALLLQEEKVPFDLEPLVLFVKQLFPDLRKTINELQKYAAVGKIDVGILAQKSVDNLQDLLKNVKAKEFPKVRQWVEDNRDIDFSSFVNKLYEQADGVFTKEDIPRIILILADYQYKANFVASQEINTLAMLTEIMITGD